MADSTNQGGSQQSADPSKTTEVPVDPFAGIDLDELPDNVRASLAEAKTKFVETQNAAKTAEDRRVQAEQFARTQQSRADKLDATVRKHNLSDDAPVQKTAEDPFYTQFIKDGLPEAQASAYAKMFASAGAIQRNALLQELSPLAATVGNIQADQVLGAAFVEHAKIMAIPEVAKQVRDNAQVLVGRNQVVDKSTINSLIQMAYGDHMMKNPQTTTTTNVPTNPQIPNFGSHTLSGGGGYVPPVQNPNSAAPQAKNAETLNAMAHIVTHLRENLPTKKK